MQNSAARLVFNRRKYDHATALMETLHWLPVKERIIYKINLLIHKRLFNVAPYELCNLLVFDPSRTGKLNCTAEVIQLGKSTAFMASKLYQDNSLVATSTSTVKLIPFSKS